MNKGEGNGKCDNGNALHINRERGIFLDSGGNQHDKGYVVVG